MVITYTFPRCWVHVDEPNRFLHTAFEDGRKLEAVPDAFKDSETAQRYGYGQNSERLWREHDILHHTIGTMFGHGVSPTIWSVAHEDDPNALPYWIRLGEEEFLGHIHRWLNLDLWHPSLEVLESLRPKAQLKEELRAILAGEVLI
jgi:hypothetical protein